MVKGVLFSPTVSRARNRNAKDYNKMATVLILGKGGREHALTKALSVSPSVARIWVSPGNFDTALEPKTCNVPYTEALLSQADLVIPGSDKCADKCAAQGTPCFGPTPQAARIETNKSFAKDQLRAAKVPTAPFHLFSDYHTALARLVRYETLPVIKASGLTDGKGVFVPETLEQAVRDLYQVMHHMGEAGQKIVMERRVFGQEVSVMAFCDGNTCSLMPQTRPHKHWLDGDCGPDTILTPDQLTWVKMFVFQPILDRLRDVWKTPFVGVLYVGLRATPHQIHVLKFKAHFGDPEAQVVLPLLKTDLYDILMACTDGTLDEEKIEWSNEAAALVETGSDIIKPTVSGTKQKDEQQVASSHHNHMLCNNIQIRGRSCRRSFGPDQHRPLKLAVLGSTQGTDLATLLQAIDQGRLWATVGLVISDRRTAGILEKAKTARVPWIVIDPVKHRGEARSHYDARISAALRPIQPDVVVLTGFMRILSQAFVQEWADRIINVHPSLLPAFAEGTDLTVHQAVLEAGVKVTGCTVHRVEEKVDTGEILWQEVCAVKSDDTPDTLKTRVQALQGKALIDVLSHWVSSPPAKANPESLAELPAVPT